MGLVFGSQSIAALGITLSFIAISNGSGSPRFNDNEHQTCICFYFLYDNQPVLSKFHQ